MNSMIEKMSELNISEEVMKEVLFVAKRMDEKGLVNSFAGNISAKKDGKILVLCQDLVQVKMRNFSPF